MYKHMFMFQKSDQKGYLSW